MNKEVANIINKETQLAKNIICKNYRLLKAFIGTIALGWIAIACYINFYIYPNFDQYKPIIEKELSKSLSHKVVIENISAQWNLFRPEILVGNLKVLDDNDVVEIKNIESTLSIIPLFWGEIEIHQANLSFDNLVVEKNNINYTINNIDVNKLLENQDSSSNLLDNAKIGIKANSLKYIDKERSKKSILLSNVDLKWMNNDKKHNFELTGENGEKLKGNFNIKGSWNEINKTYLDDEFRFNIKLENISSNEFLRQIQFDDKIKKGLINTELVIEINNRILKKAYGNLNIKEIDVFNTELKSYNRINDLKFKIDYTNYNDINTIKINDVEISAKQLQKTRIGSLNVINEGEVLSAQLNNFQISEVLNLYKEFSYLYPIKIDIKKYKAEGDVSYFYIKFNKTDNNLTTFKLNALKLSVEEKDKKIFSNLTTKIDYDNGKFNYKVELLNSSIFTDGYLEYDSLENLKGYIEGFGEINNGNIEINLNDSLLQNNDATIKTSGKYTADINKLKTDDDYDGFAEIKVIGQIHKAENLWGYLGKKSTHDLNMWLKKYIKGGNLNNANLYLNGDLSKIPECEISKNNCINLKFDIENGKFLIPQLNKLAGEVHGKYNQIDGGISIDIYKTTLEGSNVTNSNIKIDNTGTKEQQINVIGTMSGANTKIYESIKNITPQSIKRALNDTKLNGDGLVKFYYNFKNNISEYNANYTTSNLGLIYRGIEVKDIVANAEIGDNTIKQISAKGQLFGNELRLKGAAGILNLNGNVSIGEIVKKIYGSNPANIRGATYINTDINLNNGIINSKSDLVGIQYNLNKEFEKKPAAIITTNSILDLNKNKLSVLFNKKTNLEISINDNKGYIAPLNNNIILNNIGKNTYMIDFGDKLNINEWVKSESGSKTTGLNGITLLIKGKNVIYGKSLYTNFNLKVSESNNTYNLNVDSDQLVGTLTWSGSSKNTEYGKLTGEVDKFVITENIQGEKSGKIDGYPDVNVSIKKLYWGDTLWGSVRMQGFNRFEGNSSTWKLSPILIKNSNDTLQGDLTWKRNDEQTSSTFDFKLNTNNVGEFLAKLGSKGTVKNGTASAEGKLSWANSPYNYDTKTLNGEFKIESKKGQFLKMEPGAGKLLGLLSLQALPQRFLLDFKDVFGDGLEYNSIEGDFKIKNGIMTTDNLEIDTSAARILMKGTVNLYNHTQDFKIEVRPSLSNIAAIGVTVINPIAGAATFLAGKVFKDPLSMIFSSVYHVTGTWDNPEVDKKVESKQ